MTREELLNRVKTEVPETSGVYIMKDAADEVIYVGKAKVLRRRMKSYFDVSEKTSKTYALVSNITTLNILLQILSLMLFLWNAIL